MKVAVYSIALNEARHVQRMLASCREADYVLICDTGSTDDTAVRAAEHGARVETLSIAPWRFDSARNASLALLPADIDVAICLDLDEVLVPGWRQALEAAWQPDTTRLRYPYIWSWQENGEPGVRYYADKIHKRHGYVWRHPVHEVAYWMGAEPEVQTFTDALEIHHHADSSKSRSQYLPLLELAVTEEPQNDRSMHYLGREYLMRGEYDKAIATLMRHLELPAARWPAERAASMRFIARAYSAKGEADAAMPWLLRACAEASEEREPWVELAMV